jgi:hypothetical protein
MATLGDESDMIDKLQIDSFEALLSKCLHVSGNDDLLVIYDESLTPFVPAFERAITEKSVSSTLVYLPRSYQRFLIGESKSRGSADKIDLPSGVVAAIAASTAIVNLLEATPDNAPVRKAVNHTPRPNNCRLATIPGVTAKILQAILDAPVEEILNACEEMAWLLGEATEAEILSFDSHDREYKLKMNLGGWENEPIMSPGVLLPGSWGNVPPGETFCCPPHHTVNGTICINGSVPGQVLGAGQEVLLEFQRGKLISWRSSSTESNSPALAFFAQQKAMSAANNDENWNTFAELGIGLNSRITELTGNPLFDEKAAKTLHVAIGDNSVFGDDVSSFIHQDLVTWRPTLKLNNRCVMDRGVIDRALISTLRKNNFDLHQELALSDAIIHLREGRIGHHEGTLMRRLSKAQRVNYIHMSSKDISDALNELCENLARYDKVHIATFKKNNPKFGGISTARLLNVLYHYRVLGVASSVRPRADRGTSRPTG